MAVDMSPAAGVLTALVLVSSTAVGIRQSPAPLTFDITTRARAMRPGEVVLVVIRPSRTLESVEGTAFDTALHPWASANGEWRMLVGVPLAAGILAPFGFVMPPAVGAILMSLSTVVVALNAQLLRTDDLVPPDDE